MPDEEIDPDFAIDDLVFDTPRPLAEAGDPQHYSVLLTSGQRLHCESLEPGNVVTLHKVTIGIDKIELPLEEVAIVVPPRNPALIAGVEKRGFMRLDDGSVLHCQGGTGLQSTRFDRLQIKREQVVALWGADTPLVDPADNSWPQQGGLVIYEKKDENENKVTKAYLPISQWKLGPRWIESPEVAALNAFSYDNSPVVWFQKPERRAAGSGLLRLVNGEEVVLAPPGGGQGFSLISWSPDGVALARGERRWTIPLIEVGSLLLPGRDGK